MAQPKYKETEVKQRRAEVAALYCDGWTQSDIAEHLGVSQQTVSLDLKALREEWQQSALLDFHKRKLDELERLDKLEVEARADLAKSREKFKSVKRKTQPGQPKLPKAGETNPNPPPRIEIETTDIIEDRQANKAYYDVILDCIRERCKITGIYAPIRTEQTNMDGNDVTGRGVLTPEKQAEILSRHGLTPPEQPKEPG